MLIADFETAMARLGPFEPAPALAAAVSGGADSLALALLGHRWALARGGSLMALVVDHGLRVESAAEAMLTVARLGAHGIPARLVGLKGLAHGPGLAARARVARHAVLARECAADGILHLLLGHHASDQAETLMMRARAGSGRRGLAGMAALVERQGVRMLRPLLAIPPGRLRVMLRAEGVDWIEDPSNQDPASLRARLRHELADPAGEGAEVSSLLAAAREHGRARTLEDRSIAAELAARVRLYPGGWALLSGGPLTPAALSALLCTIAGRRYPAASAAVACLAGSPRAATLAGVRLLAAGRAGNPGDWLVVREAAAMAAPVHAVPGAVWDDRFLVSAMSCPGQGQWSEQGLTLGALGDESVVLRRRCPAWPAAVLRTLPALRQGGRLVAVPGVLAGSEGALAVAFRPAIGLAGVAFRSI